MLGAREPRRPLAAISCSMHLPFICLFNALLPNEYKLCERFNLPWKWQIVVAAIFMGANDFYLDTFTFVRPSAAEGICMRCRECGRSHSKHNWCSLADGVSNDIFGNSKWCLNIIKFTRARTSAERQLTQFTHTLAFNRLPHLSASSSNSIHFGYGQSFVCVCWMCVRTNFRENFSQC